MGSIVWKFTNHAVQIVLERRADVFSYTLPHLWSQLLDS